ncbi:hypothetical protein U1Q18_025061 [Sarracenia purpurea var. burkii]
MARFTILAAALVITLLAVTEAAAANLRTTITTPVVGEWRHEQEQRQEELRRCRRVRGRFICNGAEPAAVVTPTEVLPAAKEHRRAVPMRGHQGDGKATTAGGG